MIYTRTHTVSTIFVTCEHGHTPPLGRAYVPGTSPTVGPYQGACPYSRESPVHLGPREATAPRTRVSLVLELETVLVLESDAAIGVSADGAGS